MLIRPLLLVIAVLGVTAAHSGSAKLPLERPSALALGPDGTLYIADGGRDQIVARLPNGKFRVFAGTGRRGFSGDGGPAVGAELNGPAGMAVGSDGTLYFADQGNNRVRAVSPRGVISTLAGNGKVGWVASGESAGAATIGSPAAVTIGRDHRPYIAASGWARSSGLARTDG